MPTIFPERFFDQIVDEQSIARRSSALSLMSSSEHLYNAFGIAEYDAYTNSFKTYDSLAELYRKPYYLDSSFFIRSDYEDSEIIDNKLSSYSSSNEENKVAVADNTREDDINLANEQFCQFLESQTSSFVRALIWTDFEDGMENEITRRVDSYMTQNRYVTLCWLNRVFNSNRSKPSITSGLLRTLAMVVNPSDADIMLSVVTAGIASQHPEDQEAAIMIIEKWRTKECLDAMKNTAYGSDWVKEYAIAVMSELEEELGV